MKEDERHSRRRRPEAPAYWFNTLDSSHQNQFFIQKVEEIAAYLDNRLYEYSINRGRLLRSHEFRSRFLRFYTSHSIVDSFANACPLRKFKKIIVSSVFRKINNSFSLVIEFPDRMISPAYFFFSLCLAPSNM